MQQNENLIVFDPKYRVENNLPNALAEMHKYRDGIVSRSDDSKACKETYIICPNKGLDYKNMFSDAYRTRYAMGAFEFKPGYG